MKTFKTEIFLEELFSAGGHNEMCWDACDTSGIITLGEKDPETEATIQMKAGSTNEQ